MEKKVASLEERLKLARQNRFDSKNQKRRRKSEKDNSDDNPVSHGEAKDGFDGTEESLPKNRWSSESNSNLIEYCRVVTEEEQMFNSLFFVSDKMARVSAAYHTVISTCSLLGVPTLEYFKKFFAAITQGRRDYEKQCKPNAELSLLKLC